MEDNILLNRAIQTLYDNLHENSWFSSIGIAGKDNDIYLIVYCNRPNISQEEWNFEYPIGNEQDGFPIYYQNIGKVIPA